MALPSGSATTATLAPSPAGSQRFLFPFILVTCVFFLWGMAHNLDSILIPHLKKACQLDNRQSTLVDTAVFLAYFLMAIPAGMLLKRVGYKNSIIIGLVTFAAGAFLFVPAAGARSYALFLTALFIIGCGLTTLETAANPYAAVLGSPEGATGRLNLAQAFNGLSAIIAPVVGTRLILSGKEYSAAQLAAMPEATRLAYLGHEAAAVKLPYITLGVVLLVVALLFYLVSLPEVQAEESEPSAGGGFFAVLRHRHLTWAVVTQFCYVGAQVCVTSFFIRMAKQGGGLDEKTAGYYLGLYGLLFTAGRFIGTALLKYVSSQRLLSIYAVIAIALCGVAVLGNGAYVIYALGGLGFFMSIMFPTIFSLGLAGLGDDTKPGSSWLVMSIVGGAAMPYLMGTVIDLQGDAIQAGYVVPLACFVVVLLFGLYGYRVKGRLV
ncbi:L-fucose:H+ symporter permease [Hymenobacter sp. BT559]|uniref:L-fucose:H+ symporter permease n=1 Tax=Hymenobacter sp. BT559 TaxID=2795729 RepID=UPI0018EA9EFE|nr:L-fucose:H+ symporter permease [Hymenobacter sp. BT559]MBJ6145368.1 L-fucose:H+ symporter permease [Hymenobacter sp. BT559]